MAEREFDEDILVSEGVGSITVLENSISETCGDNAVCRKGGSMVDSENSSRGYMALVMRYLKDMNEKLDEQSIET